jgi:hypothetical protein
MALGVIDERARNGDPAGLARAGEQPLRPQSTPAE